MEIGPYVNSPADGGRRRSEAPRETCQSGGSRIYVVVGVSFGLLCILQFALNVLQWQQAVGVSMSNVTLERDQCIQEKNRLNQEKKQLEVKNKELQATITHLAPYNPPRCPPGWWLFMSSCYWLSKEMKTWRHAKRRCKNEDAHLVIFNDEIEEKVVLILSGGVKMWIGLSDQEDTRHWTWVDGNHLTYGTSKIQQKPGGDRRCPSCVYVDECFPWVVGSCQEKHYWMCEKELDTSCI